MSMIENNEKNPSSESPTRINKKRLEELREEIYKGWIKDVEKLNELLELISLLESIISKESIEQVFENATDFNYFIGKFSQDTIANILHQGIVYGQNGDEIALKVLCLYLSIFCKYMSKPEYQPLWEGVKEIFECTKTYYRGSGFNASKILNEKKQITADKYNEAYLQRKIESNTVVTEGMEIDVLISNIRHMSMNNPEKKIWVRGNVTKLNKDFFVVHTCEDSFPSYLKYNSFEFAPKGTMTGDWEWRNGLQVGDMVDCYDRQKWYPATICQRKESEVNGMKRVDYKVTFRVYPHLLSNWEEYKKFWPDKVLMKDFQDKEFLGDIESYNEQAPAFSKRIQPFNSMIKSDLIKIDIFENENYFIDDMIKYIDDQGKKTYVIGRSFVFSYYFAEILKFFAEIKGFETMVQCLSNKTTRPSGELVHVIFHILNAASGFFHKEYVIELGSALHETVFVYLNEMTQNELRSMKRESFDLIKKVLGFYLGLAVGIGKRNEIIEKISITFAIKMIKTSFLDKRMSGIKTIIDVLSTAKKDREKTLVLLELIEDNKIFYEIYGPNSHIQLINKSKELLEIIIREDKLSDVEMEMIWNATKKGDLESKLTIIRILKELSRFMKPKHMKVLLEEVYESKSSDLLNDEIDLIYEFSMHLGGSETLDKCIKFLTQCLLESTTDEGERVNILINKIFDITKYNPIFKTSVINMCIQSLEDNENVLLALKILHRYLKSPNIQHDSDLSPILFANDNLVNLYTKSFVAYLNCVKEKAKNWNQDIDQLPLMDNFNHSQNLKGRLNFLNVLLEQKLWKISEEPLEFVYKILLGDGIISQKDEEQFYLWIKSTIDTNVGYETEEKIFNLFNEQICKDTNACMNLSIEAFDTYLKVFLDINMKNSTLRYTKNQRERTFDVEVYVEPEQLTGFSILWKIVFESYSRDIMNKGIEILHSLYTHVQLKNKDTESYSQLLIRKCINLIKDTNTDTLLSPEAKKNIIAKCLIILKLIIEESEKRGLAGVISHAGLLRKRIITFKFVSTVSNVNERSFQLKLYGNTTVWDMKLIIGMKLKYNCDFLRIAITRGKEQQEIRSTDNGKTLLDIGIENGDEIRLFPNGMEKNIEPIPLVVNGSPVPEITEIFNDWFTTCSTNNKMTKEDCGKFVRIVTGVKDEITADDKRVTDLFAVHDKNRDGLIERDEFVNFYLEALRDRPRVVLDNLRCAGIRNDLKKMSDPYLPAIEDKTTLPRYQLPTNEEFFNVIFTLMDINEDIAKEAFNFLCVLATNPTIYHQMFLADGSSDWNSLLNEGNIFKLIYSLQIIESFIEDIEINSPNVDNLLLQSDHISTENSTHKQEWMKNFIEKGGYSHIVRILQRKLTSFVQCLESSNENSPMNCACIELLLKIVKIFYMTALNRCESYAKVINEGQLMRSGSFARSSSFCGQSQLDEYFTSQGLNDMIINSIDHNPMILTFISVLEKLVMKDRPNEDVVNIVYEFLTIMITNSNEYAEIEAKLVENQTLMDVTLYGLLNANENTRGIFSSSVIKMCKLLQKNNRFELIMYLFTKIYSLIENISKDIENNSFELFDFFSYLLEIYTANPDHFTSIKLDSHQFLQMLLDSLEKDINEESEHSGLSDALFIGFLKIVSQVAENNLEIKKFITTNYTLVQGILTKVLFKSSKELKDKLSTVEFVNPDRLNDNKSLRNSNQMIRNVCYRFVLSMLKDSIENFEKFFSVNLLEEEKKKDMDDTNKKELRFFYTSYYSKNEGHVGLKNLGCICYMNATMQQLFMVPSLRYSILRVNDNKPPMIGNAYELDDNLLHQVQRMFSYLELSERSDYNPFGFTYAFKDFSGAPTKISEQKDAQEFLSICLDRMELQIKPTSEKYTIQSVFGGKTCSQVICQNCGNTSSRYEDTPFLSLEVKNMKTLSDSLDKLISQEQIDEYACDACKKKVSITKRNSLFSLPNVLIIHLQRIFYNWEIDRNEKINSRLDFPRTLNLKQYCLEEIVRKNAAAKAKESDEEVNVIDIETDEIYFKHSSYYEYYLVGVIVHMGSADCGHYYSYINTVRGGVENEANYNPNDEAHANSWLEFNDSCISKFSASKLEDECFGGSYDTDGGKSAAWAWNRGEKSKSAYMLVYERRMKSPLKTVVDPQDLQTDVLVSFKEEDYPKIKKEYDILRYIGTSEYSEMKKKIFSSVFFDVANNEYFQLTPFYHDERLFPSQHYIDIIEDNTNFEKHQNISDERFANFFDEALQLLNEAINNLHELTQETAVKISMTFMNFILNILSKKERVGIIKPAVEKFINIVKAQKACLIPVWAYISDHQKKILEVVMNENEAIVSTNCELITELVRELYYTNPEKFIEASAMSEYDDSNPFSSCIKTLMQILSQFPRVPSKLVSTTGPIMKLFRGISLLDERILQFLGRNEFIFTFVTFLLGKESPCYMESLLKPTDSWDYGPRPAIIGSQPVVEVIYDIFSTSSGQNGTIELSSRDIKCIKSTAFLKYIFKSCEKMFTALLVTFNKDNYEFTVQSCGEIVKSIEEININSDAGELIKLTSCLLPLFALKDQYQRLRFEIILGLPQYIIEEYPRSAFPLIGYHYMTSLTSKFASHQSTSNSKSSCSLLKKIFELANKKPAGVEVILMLMEACIVNDELFEYLKKAPSEVITYNDLIDWGVNMVKTYKKNEENIYLQRLQEIVKSLAPKLKRINEPNCWVHGFMGKYILNNFKREEITVMESTDNLHLLRIEYFTSTLPFSDNLDFSKSKSFKPSNAMIVIEEEKKTEEVIDDGENILHVPEKCLLLGLESKMQCSEKDFYRNLIPKFMMYNKIIVENKFAVPGYESTLKRYVLLNSSMKDANVEIKFSRLYPTETPPNEYIPESPFAFLSPAYSLKTVYLMGKFDLNKNWTDENNFAHQLKYEFLAYRSMPQSFNNSYQPGASTYYNMTYHGQGGYPSFDNDDNEKFSKDCKCDIK